MTELHMRHFAIIAIAIIISVAMYVNYPLDSLSNIIVILSGIIATDKGIDIAQNKKKVVTQ